MSAGRIFVVDDNPNNLGLLATILREAGYEVRVADRGRRALDAIQADPPELILLDVKMPDLDGYQVCQELKRQARTRTIPVIFLSALSDSDDKVSAFRAGGVDYVTKPFQNDEVLARVGCQLAITRMQRQLEERNRQLELKIRELDAANGAADRIFTALAALLPGFVIDDKYRVGERIGRGGFGAVYRGTRLPDGGEVAIKVLQACHGDGPDDVHEHFRREVLSATSVTHPNAVTILDFGVTATGIDYVVMELLEGRTLADELRALGPLSLRRCAEIMLPVVQALAAAHAVGIIHRDIKPANIFLHRTVAGEVVKVVDFGIAKFGDPDETENQTTLGRVLGTPVYMAPERLLGHPYDGRSDVYSVGVSLYQMLAGRLPFKLSDGNLGAVILACVQSIPDPLERQCPGLPADIASAVRRALAKSPQERPSLDELIALLQTVVDGDGDLVASSALPTVDG